MSPNPFIGQPGEQGEALPRTNPETPPDSTDPRSPCPRCGNRAHFQDQGNRPVAWRRAGPKREEVVRVTTLKCSSCEQGVAVVEELWVGEHAVRENAGGGGHSHWRGIFWWPVPGAADLDEAVPDDIREAFTEGARSHGAQAPHAAAVMFRRTVEGIVRDKGSKKAIAQLDTNDLPGALKIMNNEGDLDKTLFEWASTIRALGNTGGHFDPIANVSRGQAEELLGLVRQLLRYVYEEPARMQRLRVSVKNGS
jgi:hypothetical protein